MQDPPAQAGSQATRRTTTPLPGAAWVLPAPQSATGQGLLQALHQV